MHKVDVDILNATGHMGAPHELHTYVVPTYIKIVRHDGMDGIGLRLYS